MIKEATISYVAAYGLENVTTKKVATAMGISEGTIFNNFPSKKILLVECLYHIDNQIDAVFHDVPFHGINLAKNINHIWHAYFEYLVTHGDYARFYRQFRQSSYYDASVIAGQDKSFSFFTSLISKNVHRFGFNPDFYWTYIIETTLNFAIRVVDGTLPGTPKDVERIYGLICYGFIGNLKPFKE